jgi:hypothetical protein
MVWSRKCNECGHRQTAKKPSDQRDLSDAYRNSKCRKCQSEGLDYGTDDFEQKGPALFEKQM